jgi:hypothetical protein
MSAYSFISLSIFEYSFLENSKPYYVKNFKGIHIFSALL